MHIQLLPWLLAINYVAMNTTYQIKEEELLGPKKSQLEKPHRVCMI